MIIVRYIRGAMTFFDELSQRTVSPEEILELANRAISHRGIDYPPPSFNADASYNSSVHHTYPKTEGQLSVTRDNSTGAVDLLQKLVKLGYTDIRVHNESEKIRYIGSERKCAHSY